MIITKRVNKLLDIINSYSSLENYFGIKNDKNTIININFIVDSENKEIQFIINFKKKKYYNFINLPIEICHLISLYSHDIIKMKITVNFSLNYPFKRPLWILDDVENNFNSLLNLKDYYNYIIEIHNLKKWSPIISIDKDFLEFFQKINYFDFILEYK